MHDAKWRAECKLSGFPDLSKHNNWMAKCITEQMYNNMKDKTTKLGVSLDKCIQTGMCSLRFHCNHMPPAEYLGRCCLVRMVFMSDINTHQTQKDRPKPQKPSSVHGLCLYHYIYVNVYMRIANRHHEKQVISLFLCSSHDSHRL